MTKEKDKVEVVDGVVHVPKTALQARAEKMKQMRADAIAKRARKGIETDPGVTFADLPQEMRDDYFQKHESGWKENYNASQRRKGAQASQSYERGEPFTFKG